MGDYLKISFCGDIMCLKEQIAAVANLPQRQAAFNSIFAGVKPLFKDSDLVIGNLETPVCDAEVSSESICFNTPVEFLMACKWAGFTFLTTANNHCLDRGIEGLNQTIANIDRLGIGHTGTYTSEKDSNDISVVDVLGKTVAIVCVTFGTNSEVNGNMLPEEQLWRVDLLKKQNKPAKTRFNPDGDAGKKSIIDNVSSAAITNSVNQAYLNKFLNKIRKAKDLADIVIAYPHIGGQYNAVPGKYTRYIVSEIANIQPSFIVANHPHVPLRMEKINDVCCAYSLGNFSFTPDVGYYIPNVLAEYGIVLHTYWSKESGELVKSTFSIIKNVVDNDGIAKVIPINTLHSQLQTTLDKERLLYESEAVAVRFTTSLIDNPLEIEIPIVCLPPPPYIIKT